MSRPQVLAGALVAGAALVALPSSASANRPATAQEQAAIVRDLGIGPSAPQCSAFLVSTAPGDGAAYARIQPIDPLPAGCAPAGTTFVIVRSPTGADGPWNPVVPGRPEAPIACADAAVPDDVGADLAACAPSGSTPSDARSRTTLGCYPTDGAMDLIVQRRRPSRCLVRRRVAFDSPTTFRPQQSASGYDLRGVRWKHWGSARATGTGTARVVKAQRTSAEKVPVTLTATTIRTDGGRLFYTKLKVRTPTGTSTLMLNWPS